MSERRVVPADLLGIAIGVIVVVVGGFVAHYADLARAEVGVFRALNDLPDAFRWALVPVMQLGTLWAVLGVVAVSLSLRKWWAAAGIVAAGFVAYETAPLVKHLIARPRPSLLLEHVVVRGPHAVGYGYASGHSAIAAAMATVLSPHVPKAARYVLWAAAVLVGVARCYVGAHFPLDIVGGLALGWAAGSLVNVASREVARSVA